MTQKQQKYLDLRLANAGRAASSRIWRETYADKKPAHVRHAERVIKRWENDRRHRRDRAQRVVGKRAQTVKETLLFGDAKKALAAVKAFEKMAKGLHFK